MRRFFLSLLALAAFALPAQAQQAIRAAEPATSGRLAALNNEFVVDTSGFGTVGVQVTGTFVGTIAFETSTDRTTWRAAACNDPSVTVGNMTTTTTGAGLWTCPATGRFFRTRMSAFTSGAATVYQQLRVGMTQRSNVSLGSSIGVTGPAAHDATISGNPVRIGGRAATANYTAVLNGEVADVVTTLVGAQITKPFSIPELDWQYAIAAPVTTAATTAVKAAAGTGIRNYLTGLQLKNIGATATEVTVLDGSTVIWRGHLSANMGAMDDYTFMTPLKTTANAALSVGVVTAGASVYIAAQGYAAP